MPEAPRVDGRAAYAQGIARGVRLGRLSSPASTRSWQVLSFRLDQFDQNGNQIRPIPVEMRGTWIYVQMHDGDTVAIRGKWRRGTLIASDCVNVTTGAMVQALDRREVWQEFRRDHPSAGWAATGIRVFVIIWIAVLLVLCVGFWIVLAVSIRG